MRLEQGRHQQGLVHLVAQGLLQRYQVVASHCQHMAVVVGLEDIVMPQGNKAEAEVELVELGRMGPPSQLRKERADFQLSKAQKMETA